MIRRPPRSTPDSDRRQRQMCIRDSQETLANAIVAGIKSYYEKESKV